MKETHHHIIEELRCQRALEASTKALIFLLEEDPKYRSTTETNSFVLTQKLRMQETKRLMLIVQRLRSASAEKDPAVNHAISTHLNDLDSLGE